MNEEKFSKIASSIQSLVLAIAVIVGGWWTLYTFGSLQQVEKAKAEVERLRRSLLERGVLVITLRPSQIRDADPSMRYLLVDVEILNKGNSTEIIDWGKSRLTVTKVDAARSGGLAFGQPLKVEYSMPGQEPPPTSSILPSQTRVLPFLVPIRQRGIWFIRFEAIVSPSETPIHLQEHALSASNIEAVVWSASTYFNVE